jgi:hypothetical protein
MQELVELILVLGPALCFGACTDINEHKLPKSKLKKLLVSIGKFLSYLSHDCRRY